MMRRFLWLPALFALAVVAMSCEEEELYIEEEVQEEEEPRVGFEIMQIVSLNEIITWANKDMTLEEFNAIELPEGWFKNQPREIEMDQGAFARSPSASSDGEFVEQEHFGHQWLHVATVVETGIELDEEGLLSGNKVAKFHEVSFYAGKTLKLIISPEGEQYVRISRDFERTVEEPTIPETWQELDYFLTENLTLQLPDITMNIRADNEDSYQGPVEL